MTSMPLSDPPDPVEVVLGVDTHKDLHVAAVLNSLGVLLGTESFPATAQGYRRMLVWARRFSGVQGAGVECTGSSGRSDPLPQALHSPRDLPGPHRYAFPTGGLTSIGASNTPSTAAPVSSCPQSSRGSKPYWETCPSAVVVTTYSLSAPVAAIVTSL